MANLGLMHEYKTPNRGFVNMAKVKFSPEGIQYTFLAKNKCPADEALYIKDNSSLCLVEIIEYDEKIEEDLLAKNIKMSYFDGFLANVSEIQDIIPEEFLDEFDFNLLKDLEENRSEILAEYCKIKTMQKELLAKKSENRICECGSKMILRSSSFGEFYGCSTFPKCKLTQKKGKKTGGDGGLDVNSFSQWGEW